MSKAGRIRKQAMGPQKVPQARHELLESLTVPPVLWWQRRQWPGKTGHGRGRGSWLFLVVCVLLQCGCTTIPFFTWIVSKWRCKDSSRTDILEGEGRIVTTSLFIISLMCSRNELALAERSDPLPASDQFRYLLGGSRSGAQDRWTTTLMHDDHGGLVAVGWGAKVGTSRYVTIVFTGER